MASSGDLPDPRSSSLTPLALEAARGGPGAADRLWEAVRPRLSRIALAIGIPPDNVPDLVQDVLLAAHRQLARFDPQKGTIELWLSTSLVRRARNAFRAERRRRKMVERLGSFFTRPTKPQPIDAVEARLTLTRLLDGLTDGQREVIALYEIGEHTAEDTGRLLGITAAGVRSIARDARVRLARAAQEARLPAEARR